MRFRDNTQMEELTTKIRNYSDFRLMERGKTKLVFGGGMRRRISKKMITEQNEDVQQKIRGQICDREGSVRTPEKKI